jgi:diguanylate cyclase (GGDEF)-like protein
MGKRQHKRRNIDHPAIVVLKSGTEVDCRIQNFSYGGLFLIAANNNSDSSALDMPSGTVAAIQIPTQRDTKVIQITTAHFSGGGLGVAFVTQENELLNYLQRQSATNDLPQNLDGAASKQGKMGGREISIVNWINSATKRFLESRYQEFIKSTYNILFDAANNADSDQTQNSLFDAYNALQNYQDEMEHLFLNNVNTSFDRFSSGGRSYNKSAESPSQHPEMELVAKEDFEEWVSVVSLTRSLEFEISSKLHQLEKSLSFLAKTYINNEKNPVSPYSLLWSFKNSFSDLDITLQAKKILFSSFQHNILRDIRDLYDEINLHLDKQGITQQAQDKSKSEPQKLAPAQTSTKYNAKAQANASKRLTDTLSTLIGFISNKTTPSTKSLRPEQIASKETVLNSLANISAAGQRPIIQKIEEQLSGEMVNGRPRVIDNEIRETIQISEQLLGSLQQDSFMNPEILGLIDSLKIPFIKEAINDPMLLNDTSHPGHKLIETIGNLVPYLSTSDQSRSSKGFIYQTIEEVSRLTEQGAQLDIKQVTGHLEKVIDHQKNNFKNNLSIVSESCEQDEQYRAAKKHVFKLLCPKLTNGSIPIVIEQLLYLGWVGLLVHTTSTLGKDDESAIRLFGVIDLLLDIFNAEQGIKQIEDTQNNYLIKVIRKGFSKYPLHADDAGHYLTRLEAILKSRGTEHPTIANTRVIMDQAHIKQLLDEQTTKQPEDTPSPDIEKTWLDLVDGIKLDDWIVEKRKQGHVRMLNMAWKNTASTRYVFVDGEGKKRLDSEHHSLAKMFKQQQCSLLEDGNIPIVERAVNRLLKNTFEQIKSESDTDELTGLLGRKAFQKKISELLEITNEFGGHHIMLELDIDQFGAINDLCGTKGGDKLLQTFSNIITNYLPENAILARTGNDEFGILLNDCSMSEGYHIAETQRRALENLRYTWDGTTVPATASVGVVHIDVGVRSAVEVLSMASSARELAFQDGGNCTKIYQPTNQDIEKQRKMSLPAPIIENALKNNQLSLFAQPIISVFMGDGDEHHYEILLRIKNVDGTWEGPEDFIQAAEKSDRMRAVDRWVINHIFTWLGNNHQEINNTGISINLSAHTLDDDSFFAFISEHLDTSPFPCNKITFEITETSLVKHIDKAKMLVEDIKRKGCKFSLDDFGTGYSSYSYLKDFPVDHVKIDGSFIKDILTDSSSYAMVKSITEISHHMGKKVVAEYVENEAVMVALRELEVDFAQGYYLGQPAPINSLLQTIL